jgi:hypothetical protein
MTVLEFGDWLKKHCMKKYQVELGGDMSGVAA